MHKHIIILIYLLIIYINIFTHFCLFDYRRQGSNCPVLFLEMPVPTPFYCTTPFIISLQNFDLQLTISVRRERHSLMTKSVLKKIKRMYLLWIVLTMLTPPTAVCYRFPLSPDSSSSCFPVVSIVLVRFKPDRRSAFYPSRLRRVSVAVSSSFYSQPLVQ